MYRLTLLVVLLIPFFLPSCASKPAAPESLHPVAARESARRCLENGDYGAALDAYTREIEIAQRRGDRRDSGAYPELEERADRSGGCPEPCGR